MDFSQLILFLGHLQGRSQGGSTGARAPPLTITKIPLGPNFTGEDLFFCCFSAQNLGLQPKVSGKVGPNWQRGAKLD